MAWRLEGTYFENCNCDVPCPCATTGFMYAADNERCVVVFAFHVDSGEIEGVDVSGLNLAVVADAPGQMADGNWRVGVIMDERATQEQAEALGAVFSGQKGGPMGALAPLLGEQLGLETAAIDYSNGGVRHRVKLGDFGEIETEDFVPEGMTEPTRLSGVAHPVNSTVTVGRATKSKVNVFGIEFASEGKNAHAAPFAWSG
jgi:hypothetical protein